MDSWLNETKATILIVDDSDMNRIMLTEFLCDKYNVMEAKNGVEAVETIRENESRIDLVLLDIMMPQMNGFEVLAVFQKYHWLDHIPVIVISSEDEYSYIHKAYEMGATDYMRRPFDRYVVERCVDNTIMLYRKQKDLIGLLEEQIYEKEKNNNLLIDVLGHIVEFRNGESGRHIQNIQIITTLFLQKLTQLSDQYSFSESEILTISTASALHDIGKINIEDRILNKPGKLTKEEFEIMKTHAAVGADMLKNFMEAQENSLINVAYEICRWHHERYDGKGYPDGLSGDQIPISAQVVALADVYDALTSERCYKKAFSHEKAIQMIENGECGAFNPLLLDCLNEIKDEMVDELRVRATNEPDPQLLLGVAQDLMQHRHVVKPASSSSLKPLVSEWEKINFFTEDIHEIQFTYDAEFQTVTLSPWGANYLGLSQIIVNPADKDQSFLGKELIAQIIHRLHKTTPEHPEIKMEFLLSVKGEFHSYRLVSRSLWSDDALPKYKGALGRLVDLEEKHSLHISDSFFSVSGDKDEIATTMLELRKIFDKVRLVDAKGHELRVDEQGKICAYGDCFALWERKNRCDNCISYQALTQHKKMTKFETVGDELYQIFSRYIEVDGVPCVMEMGRKMQPEEELNRVGNEFLQNITQYNKILYCDAVTETYNRRYYKECARKMDGVYAVAMMDCDNFKEINDKFGHDAGDDALRIVSKTVELYLETQDILIRYGGDEFVLLCPDITQTDFENKLRKMEDAVSHIAVPNFPDMKLSVTIGAVYDEGDIDDKIRRADYLMYKGKRTGEHLIMES